MALTIDQLVTKIIADPTTKQRCFDLAYDTMPAETGVDLYTVAAGGRMPKVPDARNKFTADITNYNAEIAAAPNPAAGVAAAAGAHADTHCMLSWLLAKYNVNDSVQVARNDLSAKPGAMDVAFNTLWANRATRALINAPVGSTKEQAKVHYMTHMATNPSYRNTIANAAAPDLAEARNNQYHFRKIPGALLVGGLFLAGALGLCSPEAREQVLNTVPYFGVAAGAGLALFYGLRKRY